MGFVDYVKKAIDVVKLDTSAMKVLAKDPKAFTMGIAMLALAGLAAGIGSLSPVAMVTAPVLVVLMSFVGVGVLHLLALLFGGKGKYGELYNVMSHTAILNWVMAVPLLGGLLAFFTGLWRIVVAVVVLENVHGLSRGKAVAVVLIPVIIVAIVVALLFTAMLAMMGGVFGGFLMQGMMGRS